MRLPREQRALRIKDEEGKSDILIDLRRLAEMLSASAAVSSAGDGAAAAAGKGLEPAAVAEAEGASALAGKLLELCGEVLDDPPEGTAAAAAAK